MKSAVFILALFVSIEAVAQADDAYEEIVVKASIQCGPWPLPHRGVIGCTYTMLAKDELDTLVAMRSAMIDTCLSCEGERCTAKSWPDEKVLEPMLCRRLFWTPLRISSLARGFWESKPLHVTVSYAVSASGRVKQVDIVSFEGDIERDSLQQLLEDGSKKAQFKPIVVGGTAYEVHDLRGKWEIDGPDAGIVKELEQ